MKRHIDEELKELYKEILEMGALAQEAIFKSVEALGNRDKISAQEVISADGYIDALELKIDEHCIDLIARYQPMAKDLRFITTGMKLNAELERIADLALDICQRVMELADKPLLKPLIDIPKLSEVARKMVCDSIDSFIKRDVALAKGVVLLDPYADELRDRVQLELVDDFMSRDPTTATRAIPLFLIARHLERICDHATNIAEDVIYMVEARVVKHQHEEL
ncbi:MAG: phosphate signaling complex protein PhoU [Candidatus Omnitrophica bacterium]|nr:phosphate signaling complex protein PhoU [Candidatus Omnitrophota bacterium]